MANFDFDLGTYGSEIVLDSSKFDKGMNKAEDKMDKTKKKTKGFGKAIGGIATVAMAGLGAAALGSVAAVAGIGAALGGAAVAGTKMAGDLHTSLNKLQMATGSTDDEMKVMEESLKDIYNAGYGQSFTDIADSMGLVKQNTGLAGDALEDATQQALLLRDAFGYDVSESTRAASKLMEEFGVTSEKAMSMLAEGTQKGLNKSGDLIDTVEEYSVYFEKAGFDAEDMFAMMENASKSGVRNLDYVGDAMKEFGIIMKEDSEKAATALSELGLPAQELIDQFAKGGEGAKKSFQTIVAELGKIEDPLERNRVGVELFGTKFEDLEADAVLAMGNLEGSVKGSKGTLDNLNQVKFDSLGEAIKGIGRNFKTGLLLPLGELILPILSKFANWIHSKMPLIQAVFANVFNVISTVAKKVWSFFVINMLPTLKNLWLSVSTLFPVIEQISRRVFNAIVEVARTLWNFYKVNLLPILLEFYNWIASKMPVIKKTMKQVFDKIVFVAKKVWSFFKNNILPILARFFEKVQDNLPKIKETFENVFKIIADVVEIAWDIIENVLIPTIEWLWKNVIKPWMPKIAKYVEDAFDTIVTVVGGAISIFEDVTGAIKDAVDWLGKWNDKPVRKKDIPTKDMMDDDGFLNPMLSDDYIPGYAVGTPFVPNDQIAQIHKGEAIIPAKYNPFNSNGKMRGSGSTNNTNNSNYNYHMDFHIQNLNGNKNDAEYLLNEVVKGVKMMGGNI